MIPLSPVTENLHPCRSARLSRATPFMRASAGGREDSVREIPLTQGKVALVDEEDYERVSARPWFAVKDEKVNRTNWYARTRDGARHISLHRFILGAERGIQIDHKDGDGLNCRRENLRIATHGQNMQNRSKGSGSSRFKGVTWWSLNGVGRWRAQIGYDGTMHHIGLFNSEEEAARAYDAKAREHFGEFARTNFAEGA
jgi:hypothetical protein